MSIAKPPRPARPLRRWLVGLAVVAVGAIGLAAAYFAYEDAQIQREWRAACEEADRLDPGWRWEELVAARPVLPDERNGFLRARAVAKLVPAWKPRGQDKIIDEYLHSPPQHRPSDAVLAALRQRIAAAPEPALADALKLTDCPEGRIPIPAGPAVLVNIPSSAAFDDLIRGLLYPHLVLQVEAGDLDAALVALRAIVYTSRPLADCPESIQNLTAVATRSFAADGVERMLAQGEPPVAVLNAARRLLEPEAGRSMLLPGGRGYRALVEDIQRGRDDGRPGGDELLRGPRWISWRPFDGWINRLRGDDPFHRTDATALVRYYTWLIERLRESPDGLIEHADEVDAMHEQLPRQAKDLVTLSGFAPEVATREARFRCAVVALATEQFRLAHGDWPTTLGELVPTYLEAVPHDPFTSQPLRLARRPDGIVIYSVGGDRQDNGGDLDLGQPTKGRDIGVRLWDVNQRRQPPLPSKFADGVRQSP